MICSSYISKMKFLNSFLIAILLVLALVENTNANNNNLRRRARETTTAAPRCGCLDCDSTIWSTPAPAGGIHTCGSRIEWVMGGNGNRELDACALVAKEFPSTCGRRCDPASCRRSVNKNQNNRPIVSVVRENNEKNNSPVVVSVKQPVSAQPFFSVMQQQQPSTTKLEDSNVIIFDPSTSVEEIQGTFDRIFYEQVNNEMGSERYALYFKPGIYGSPEKPLQLQIGYYTEVAGLGFTPDDVRIYGKIEVHNRCFAEKPYDQGLFIPADGTGSVCFALNTFWRSLSNLAITIVNNDPDDCRRTAMFWAISQASSMRRAHITGGDVSLMDYCTQPAFASGGYVSQWPLENKFANLLSILTVPFFVWYPDVFAYLDC